MAQCLLRTGNKKKYGRHEEAIGLPAIPDSVLKAIIPMYKALSKNYLIERLEKCTQKNESLNAIIFLGFKTSLQWHKDS